MGEGVLPEGRNKTGTQGSFRGRIGVHSSVTWEHWWTGRRVRGRRRNGLRYGIVAQEQAVLPRPWLGNQGTAPEELRYSIRGAEQGIKVPVGFLVDKELADSSEGYLEGSKGQRGHG